MVAISAICSTRSVLRCDDLQKPIRTQAFILQGVRCVITFITGIGRPLCAWLLGLESEQLCSEGRIESFLGKSS